MKLIMIADFSTNSSGKGRVFLFGKNICNDLQKGNKFCKETFILGFYLVFRKQSVNKIVEFKKVNHINLFKESDIVPLYKL